MRRISKSTATAIAGIGALALLSSPSFAGGGHSTQKAGAPVQSAQMSQSQNGQWKGHPGPMGMMGPGMMRSSMGAHGGMGPGMMGPGMMGHGMMTPGANGHGMMGSGFSHGSGLGDQVVPSKDLTADDVRHFLEHRLEMQGNKRLKLGEVNEADDKIVADITTLDGSLVQRFEVDRHTGQMSEIE